jgi:hypothetical protein
MRTPSAVLLALSLALSATAHAQLEIEKASRPLDLRRRAVPERITSALPLKSFKDRYRYETESFRRLIPIAPQIQRCVDGQRATAGEFHTRLDFVIEPSGKLKTFSVGHRLDQLQACLLPHALSIRFPPFAVEPGFTLQVIVASPGVQLGRRVEARPVAVYPVGSEAEKRAYLLATSWVYTPWSMGIDRCGEWVDQSMGFGYRVGLEIAVSKRGLPDRATLTLEGKLATKGIELLARCVTPFVQALQAPPHDGARGVVYRKGTTTAGWGIR